MMMMLVCDLSHELVRMQRMQVGQYGWDGVPQYGWDGVLPASAAVAGELGPAGGIASLLGQWCWTWLGSGADGAGYHVGREGFWRYDGV